MNTYRALRLSRRPTLAIHHHPPKHDLGDRTPFGSIYHKYSTRSIIEARRATGEDGIFIGLFHKKLSEGIKRAPIGAQVIFADMAVIIRPVDPATIPGLAEDQPLTVRIAELLKHGMLDQREIAEELGISRKRERANLASLLRTLKHRGRLTRHPNGQWGLAAGQ